MRVAASFAIPGDPTLRTGGYIYDARIAALLPGFGVDVNPIRLPASFPFPDASALAESAMLLRNAPAGPLLIDGLAYGALPVDLIRGLRHKIVALVHHPLGLEAGLSAAQAQALIASERTALALADAIVVTSAVTKATLVADFAVAATKITIAEPGTEAALRATGSAPGTAPALLAVGSLVPRKGYDVLLQALARLKHLPWHLRLIGSFERAPEHAAALREMVVSLGLEQRVSLDGERDSAALDAAYAGADVFVSSSHYEGYGMVLTEALARGLPLVTTTGGAAGETVPDAAALKIPPGDVGALGAALSRILMDAALRQRLADGAWAAARHLPTWAGSAQTIAQVLQTLGDKR